MSTRQQTKFAPLRALNSFAKERVLIVQEYFALAWLATRFMFTRPFYVHETFHQMEEIGVQSLGIVVLTGFFTGMVLALQSAATMETFGATIYIGRLVSAAMIRELGPVLTGLMIAGRVGSGIAAQIGSMAVTEQIDALNTMGTDPIRKLVTPRIIAALIMLPILTIVFDFISIFRRRFTGVRCGNRWRPVVSRCATFRVISYRECSSQLSSGESSP
jgi:phospholipid/cholesterol/gamma-HCH transport system permease protein